MQSVQTHVRDVYLFQNLASWYSPWSDLATPNLTRLVTLTPLTVISCIISTVSLFFSGSQAQRAETQPTSLHRLADGFMRLSFKKQAIMSLTSPISSFRTLANTDLAILLNKDIFEPDPVVFAFKEDSTSKGTWDMVLLIIRGLLRRPSLSGTPKVTFCSVHIHNVVAKKRDASTDLLRRLHGYMEQHSVDFIGGDFNMSAFSTVGDVFSDPEFSAPGKSFL